MNAKGLHHIPITVNDWTVSRPFYLGLAEALGAKPFIDTRGAPHRASDGRVLIFAGDGFMFSIWEALAEHRSNRYLD